MSEEFPHTVIFREYTEVPNGGGGYEREWADFMTTEAAVIPLSSAELYQAMQQTNPVNVRVYYPFAASTQGVTGDMRAVWADRDETFEVQAAPIDQGGQGEVYMVECLRNG